MRALDGTEFGIVIIGRNEGDRLRACINSALSVSKRVIYSDSASTDGSVELARSMGAIGVRVDSAQPMNAARGRNTGVAALKKYFPECGYVQFLDGDCVLQPGWCELAAKFLDSNPAVAVVCGRRFEANPMASFYNRLADEEWNTPIGRAEACGGDSMIRIASFEEVGGFNPTLMASEEPELTARLRHEGWQVWRLDAPMSEHDARIFTLGQWWRRTTRSGYGYAQAWLSTKALPERVNGRLLRSAACWVIAFPLIIVAMAIGSDRKEFLLIFPTLYAAQIFRIAARRGRISVSGLRVSALLMLAKVPELIGATLALLAINRPIAIEYKTLAVPPTTSR